MAFASDVGLMRRLRVWGRGSEGYGAHLIRLVLWRGTAGEELAYKGALSSDRPLHRATAGAIGSL